MKMTVVVAGSTERTLLCAKALSEDPRFEIVGVLTPSPKPIGRKQIVTKNPLHQWAEANQIPMILIEKKIDESVQQTLSTEHWALSPDFLLVVDFGYIVPQWLLDMPTIAPVNIHPSDLPKYRGSSPGQFVLAFGERKSAVSVMVMDAKLDHGPIITKIPFSIETDWCAPEYYAHAFALATAKLPDILADFASRQESTAQPDESPTPTARMLTRDDGYVPYKTLISLLNLETPEEPVAFLEKYQLATNNYQLYCLWRGLTPWPGLWTLVDDNGAQKRMKLLKFRLDGQKLFLDEVQVEGKLPTKFEKLIP